jgi:AraC-like DNA-binding protein
MDIVDDFYRSEVSDEVLGLLEEKIHEASLLAGISGKIVQHLKLASEACASEKSRQKSAIFLQQHGLLATWQLATAKSILASSASPKVAIKDAARACAISAGHFARSFKGSTGCSPYRWATERRLERAKYLLINTPNSLADLALSCGYAGQSHFTRVFSRHVGMTPGAWRRAFKSIASTP